MFPSVLILGTLNSPFQDNYQICSYFQALEQMRWPYYQIRRGGDYSCSVLPILSFFRKQRCHIFLRKHYKWTDRLYWNIRYRLAEFCLNVPKVTSSSKVRRNYSLITYFIYCNLCISTYRMKPSYVSVHRERFSVAFLNRAVKGKKEKQ
jgi:hypothetical protein